MQPSAFSERTRKNQKWHDEYKDKKPLWNLENRCNFPKLAYLISLFVVSLWELVHLWPVIVESIFRTCLGTAWMVHGAWIAVVGAVVVPIAGVVVVMSPRAVLCVGFILWRITVVVLGKWLKTLNITLHVSMCIDKLKHLKYSPWRQE